MNIFWSDYIATNGVHYTVYSNSMRTKYYLYKEADGQKVKLSTASTPIPFDVIIERETNHEK